MPKSKLRNKPATCVIKVIHESKTIRVPILVHKQSIDRKLFRTDLPPETLYRECGIGPVAYYYHDPRAKKDSSVPIGRLKESRALAVRVLDDQLRLALAKPDPFNRVGRTHVHRVQKLGIILGLKGHFEERVKRALSQLRKG